ncbi:MAG: hypothetical protein M1822_007536 [Bathelium mastoideum]|nr:MAG: hypothetical protein M1822_007536 [Bathelium mastoideum]
MDLAKTLIRSVARAFYDIEHVLVIDALMVHSALNGNDLASCLNMQEKPMRKYAGKLRADGLLHVHTQQVKNETNRVSSRDVFYINFHLAIDAIKYRLYRMTKHIESLSAPGGAERKELVCSRCGNDWTVMEVIDNLDMNGNYCCHRCQSILQFRTNDDAETGGPAVAENATIQRLNQQLSPLLNLMQRLDSSTVPENDWETALANARPVQRGKEDQGVKNETLVDSQLRVVPQKVKGMDTRERVEVSLVGATSAEEEERRRQEERDRKEKLRAQNQLPSWHTHSTVTGLNNTGSHEPPTTDSGANGISAGATSNGLKTEDVEDSKKAVKDATTNSTADLDGYFANLQKMMENEADGDNTHSPSQPSNTDADDDDDDDEFEDVAFTNPGQGTSAVKPLPNGVSAVKAAHPVSGLTSEDSSANVSGLNSDDEGSERGAKRVKIEAPAAESDAGVGVRQEGGQRVDVEVVESDEDEDDFVDAM